MPDKRGTLNVICAGRDSVFPITLSGISCVTATREECYGCARYDIVQGEQGAGLKYLLKRFPPLH
jgi:hypothetical protein